MYSIRIFNILIDFLTWQILIKPIARNGSYWVRLTNLNISVDGNELLNWFCSHLKRPVVGASAERDSANGNVFGRSLNTSHAFALYKRACALLIHCYYIPVGVNIYTNKIHRHYIDCILFNFMNYTVFALQSSTKYTSFGLLVKKQNRNATNTMDIRICHMQ